ncbi:DNA-deoxyinosine glycosylase [uncultured Helicobacter sp.]|uniref:DNA-deoxyinosine glycosylase n=1 Tax=uncultured Helicobacter sp. TaxID=175537 RepID=UPI002612BD7C|nr:DNA-deoxyinosine glycosylase [uncultured Helicobacter sp.]
MSNLAKTLESIRHPLEPIKDSNSKILILGSFPSVASREQGFYYSHPRNRFWEVLGRLFQYDTLKTRNREEKETFLLAQKIALYDVCIECEITNSSDESIKNPKLAPLESLLQNTQIQHIFTNGKKATQIYQRNFQKIPLPYTYLPSTSPANARYNFDKLCQEWDKILTPLQS